MTPAYELGQQAFNDGYGDNPYVPSSPEHEDFIAGWQEQWYRSYDEQWSET